MRRGGYDDANCFDQVGKVNWIGKCRRYVESLGYETMEEGFDTFCLDARIVDDLTRFWRRLRLAIRGAYAETEAS
jgi:hypothetical protein